MKKVFITVLTTMLISSSYGQESSSVGQEKVSYAKSAQEMMAEIKGKYTIDDNGNVTYTKVIDIAGMKKEDLYNRALSYFVYNYVSGKDVIQVQDKDAGLIVAKGIYNDVHVGISLITTYVDCSHIVRVDCRDEKARIIVSLMEYEKKIVGGNTPPSYVNVPVNRQYPIYNGGGQKTVMTKAFYRSHLKALETIDKIEKSIIEGNTSKNIENGGW